MTTDILRIEDLHVTADVAHGGKPIVNGINLSLRGAEVLGLIGESGAGKSTIGLAALGYARPGCQITKGRISFKGSDISLMSRAARTRLRGNRIAYIAQSAAASFNPAHRLGRQLCEAPIVHRLMKAAEARRRMVEIFCQMELPSPEKFGERYPHEVSGGQLQRAMVAMAMLTGPDVLVLDEPTTALDVTTQLEVLKIIKLLMRDHGTAALYISHDLAVVAQVADEVMVLRQGRYVEQAKTETILTKPTVGYTKALLSARMFEVSDAEKPKQEVAPIIDLIGVSARYTSSTYAVDHVDLRVPQGQTTAIVGESGSGKTTLGRVIAGLMPSAQGDVLFRGTPLSASVRHRSRESLRRIQFVQQTPDTALNPRHTIREIIGRPLELFWDLHGQKLTDRIAALLHFTELSSTLLNRRPDQLSGGQKQRVCIARALAAEPDLIICDEVTSALDPLVAKEIISLLQKLQRDHGYSYIFISHDLGLVRQIADQVAIMFKGRFVTQGDRDTVFSPPFHPYTAKLLKAVPELRRDWLDQVTRPSP